MSLIITKYGTLLLRAMGQTLLLALCGLFFACILGMIFGMLSVLKNKVCNIIAIIFVDVVRGVPMIVLAYFVFFGIPYLFNNMIGIPFTLTALQAGTIIWLRSSVQVSSRWIKGRWKRQEALVFPIGVPCFGLFCPRRSAR